MKSKTLFVFGLFFCIGNFLFAQNISWVNEPAGRLKVVNRTNEPLIIFSGSISADHILGGVKSATERYFDIASKTQEGVFILRAVKEQDFSNGNTQPENVVYERVIIVKRDDDKILEVAIEETGGDGVVYLSNDTMALLEIRVNDIDSEPVAVLKPAERYKEVFLPFGDRYFFIPTYIYADSEGVICEAFSTNNWDWFIIMPVIPTPGLDIPVLFFSGSYQLRDMRRINLLFEN